MRKIKSGFLFSIQEKIGPGFDNPGKVCFINILYCFSETQTGADCFMEKSDFVEQLVKRYPVLSACKGQIMRAYSVLETTFLNGGTVFTCGNGGSQSDADHIVGELSKGFLLRRPVPPEKVFQMSASLGEDATALCASLQLGLRALNLSSQPALSTAFANDVDPLMNLAQELFVMGRKGDSVIGLSTSGNAQNILNAFKVAGGTGIKRILFTGSGHGKCEKYADCIINVPECETYKVQELHLPIYHTICIMLENRFYGNL